ncbi:MAG: hypothetical protein OXD45_01030 [Rhodobacteraceae bacterium]|nr:hypothetical protein [Paracoccaceae bacterium]
MPEVLLQNAKRCRSRNLLYTCPEGTGEPVPIRQGEVGRGPCRPTVHTQPACSRHEQHHGIGSRDGEGEAEDIGLPPQHGGSDQPRHHQDGSGDGMQAAMEHAGHASEVVPGTYSVT